MRGSFEVAASPHFCSLSLSGFLPSPSSLPSSLRSGSRAATATAGPFGIRLFHGGSLRARLTILLPASVLVSRRARRDLPSAFSADEPLSRRLLFLFFLAQLAALRGPYVRHSCGIAPGPGIVLLPCPAFVGRYTDLRRCSPSLRASGGYTLKSVHTFVSRASQNVHVPIYGYCITSGNTFASLAVCRLLRNSAQIIANNCFVNYRRANSRTKKKNTRYAFNARISLFVPASITAQFLHRE